MAEGPVTMADIAREAGVSLATASRALSELYNARSPKQRRVREVARKYNYLPNPAARSLGTGQTNLLCIVLPETMNPYYSEMFSRVEAAAAREGYSLIMQRGADGTLLDQLISRRPDGLLLSDGFLGGLQGAQRLEALRTLARYMPIVMLGRPIEAFPCASVFCNLREGAKRSVRHLYTLGHRRIAMLGGVAAGRALFERERGYDEEMARLGLVARFEARQRAGYRLEDGAAGVLKMLSAQPRAEWPTALLAVNDLVAMGALRQLDRMGLRVPEDMAVVGCDNQFFSAYTHPPLTTVDLGLEEQARLAVHYLLHHEPGTPLAHEIDSALVVRESCGAALR